ncbi:CDP-glucose 4,6-dehydratase [Adhaeribacter radiodurans]|uniref:CDP-glucose 4,6-dehydratase n=1 Tax=Adhaeribacter radiodurans TaxID=2745197 RepID=A0A7L7L840_9BACT|nr:CDP-glucose 4,6-dehydratase [Adhaeribacter radiodurans]QMU28967.1 CDP-glucose 4,6-dehydratase [Adhaeribacter radiodurans]
MEAFLRENYAGQKVFVTGHTGFKGSWLLVWLKQLGAEVMGYAKAPETQEELFNQISGEDYCYSVIGDVLDKPFLTKCISEFQPSFVFHLAAQPLVRTSYEIPVETFEVNTIGTANVLNAVRTLSGKCTVVIITTDKVYDNQEWPYPYREVDALGGYDPYSASKACAELVTNSYRNSFFNVKTVSVHQKTVATARAGNVIGGGDWARDRIVPDIVRALQNKNPIPVRNPLAIRPWQHVLEPLFGYLLLGAKLAQEPEIYSGAWNFGPNTNDTLPVEKLAQLAVQVWGEGCIQNLNLANQPHEAGVLKLDISKTQKLLKWRPYLNTIMAVERTIQWYKSFLLKESSASELILADIASFLNQINESE